MQINDVIGDCKTANKRYYSQLSKLKDEISIKSTKRLIKKNELIIQWLEELKELRENYMSDYELDEVVLSVQELAIEKFVDYLLSEYADESVESCEVKLENESVYLGKYVRDKLENYKTKMHEEYEDGFEI